MGHWNLTINGCGQHHNNDEADIDRLAAKLIQHLKTKGHKISHARLTYGGEQELTHVQPDTNKS